MAGPAGVDCSQPIAGRPLVDAAKSWCGRYLTTAWPDTNAKQLRAPEVADLHGHGIAILLLGEDGHDDLIEGPAAAASRAVAFAGQAVALGAPADHSVAIVMSDDQNGSPEDPVIAAMTAAQHELRSRGFLAGYYGRKSIARRLQAAGLVDVVCVVDTWGATLPSDHWNFRQLPNAGQPSIGGVTCDVDDAPYPVGLWTRTTAPPPPAPRVASMHPPYPLDGAWIADLDDPKAGGAWLLTTSGAIYAAGSARPVRGCNGTHFFAGRTAASLCLPNQTPPGARPPTFDESSTIVVVIDTAGYRYALPTDAP